MNQSQQYTPEDSLLIHIFGDYAAKVAEVSNKPLSEITLTDLAIIRQMPIPPDGIIIYDMKTGDKRSGKIEFTEEMKNNLVRFAKENAKDYLHKINRIQ